MSPSGAGRSRPSSSSGRNLSSLDVCAGAGGLALGLQQAGFEPVLLLDNRDVACDTLRINRPNWDVRETDLIDFDPGESRHVYAVDLLSAGLPRVKATAAVNRGRGSDRELALLRATILLVHGVRPRALLIENVPDLATKDTYEPIREHIGSELDHLGYRHTWFVVNAADYGVPQDRKQGMLVALTGDAMDAFLVPPRVLGPPVTVGMALRESMSTRGWRQADEWAAQANRLAPTLVGGSWERGGADLGPRGSKAAWARMGVDGGTVADRPPAVDFQWNPTLGRAGFAQLTVDQAARLQGFPADWRFSGRKTARYRQVAEASPPPVARAMGLAIADALNVG